MKVLLVCSFQPGGFGRLIYWTLKRIGVDVLAFDNKLNYFRYGRKMNRMLWRWVEAWTPDVLLVFKGVGVEPSVVGKMRCSRKILWFPDEPYRYAFYERLAAAFDEVYNFLFGCGAEMLAPAIYPPVHREVKLKGEEKWRFSCDCVFVGTGHPRRRKQIRELMHGLKVKMKIWGNDWPAEFKAGPPQYYLNLSKAISGAKVVFNTHYAEHTPNQRCFEATACRRLLISDSSEGLEKCFKPGREFIPYSSIREAWELIEFYVENEEERNRIAEAGWKRCLRDHTLEKRLREIL